MVDQAPAARGDDERSRLETAIAALEAQRELLGDAVVNTALDPLRAELAALDRAPARSPRRQVSVLFADLSGYTTLAEGVDPEAVIAMLNGLWGRVDDLVAEHGGRVIAHMGDGIMAAWGVDEATEEDAERAVRAALRAVADVADHGVLLDGRRHDAALSVGVHTGPVHRGEVGRQHEISVIGDTTNVAARLEGLAAPGQVLISRDTYHHVRGVFDVSEAGAVELKGRAAPVAAYSIDAERPRAFRTGRRGIEGVDVEFYGRTDELGAVQQAYVRCIGGGPGELVTILGEPGIGKSRLVGEFRDWLEISTTTRVRYFEAIAVRERVEQPYAFLRSLFSHRFEIADTDGHDEVRAKLEAGLADLVGRRAVERAATISWVLGFTPSTDDVARGDSPGRTQAGRAALVETVGDLLGAMPALAVLEDVHWADAASLDVLAEVLARPSTSTLVLATARPDLRRTHPTWSRSGAITIDHHVIDLDPFDTDRFGHLVDALLARCDEVPDRLRQRLVDQAGGNPFHLEELVRMLIDHGVIHPGPTWTVDLDRLDSTPVPSTLAGVVQSRLDHLPIGQYRALQHASVIGRTFWDLAVARLADPGPGAGSVDDARRGEPDADAPGNADVPDDVDAVRVDLAALVEADFARRRQPSQVVGTSEFEFIHDINRVVTYGTVRLEDRPALHRAAAGWLIGALRERADEFAITIADHLDAAGEPASARRWFERAAAMARSQGAYVEAAGLWGEAGRRCGEPADRDRLLVQEAASLVVAGRFDDARERLERARGSAEERSDVAAAAEAGAGLAGIAMFRDGDFGRAEQLLSESLHALTGAVDQRSEHRRVELVVRHQLGNLAIAVGRWDEAVVRLEDCLRRGVEAHPTRHGITLNSLAHAYAQLGRVEDTYRRAEQAASIAERIGEPRLAMGALAQRGLVALRVGEYGEARRWFGAAQELNVRNGDPEKLATVWNYLGECSVGLGELDRAAKEFDDAIDVGQRCGAVPELVRAVVGHAAIAAARGDTGLAAEWLAGARTHRSAGGEANRGCAQVTARYGLDLDEAEVVGLDAAIEQIIDRRIPREHP